MYKFIVNQPGMSVNQNGRHADPAPQFDGQDPDMWWVRLKAVLTVVSAVVLSLLLSEAAQPDNTTVSTISEVIILVIFKIVHSFYVIDIISVG